MTKTVSVVIPTHNRSAVLKRTLEALLSQPVPADAVEIIVVDDGSADATARVVQEMAVSSAMALRYLHQEQRGAGAARNRGIQHALAPIILFMDDDIIAAPSLLAEHVQGHSLHPELNLAMLGRIMLAPEIPATALNRMHAVHKWQSLQDGHEVGWRHFFTGNISIKRAFLMAHHLLFDEDLQRYQDIEFGYRCQRQGLRILYQAHALGYHYHDLNFQEYLRICDRYGEALAVLHHRYPELRTELGQYYLVSQRNWRKQIVRNLARSLVSSRLVMEPLLWVTTRAQRNHLPVPTFVLLRIGNFYERRSYLRKARQLREASIRVES